MVKSTTSCTVKAARLTSLERRETHYEQSKIHTLENKILSSDTHRPSSV